MLVKKRPKSTPNQSRLLPKILVLAGIVLLVIVVFLFKNQTPKATNLENQSPEAQLDQNLKEGKPILAFYHSYNCQSCLVMMGRVYQIYPEFEDSIALVDIDVYDSHNTNLLRRARIHSIPTLVFIDQKGQKKVSIGVMEEDQLRQQLQALKGTP